MMNPLRQTFVRAAPAVFVLLWSTGYIGARYGLPYAEPMTLSAIRFLSVVVILAFVIGFGSTRLPRDPRLWLHLAVSGILLQAGFTACVFIAIHAGVNVGITALVAGAQPLLTAILVVPLLGERLSRGQWAGFVIGFAGLAMVIARSIELGHLPATGLAASIVALCGITFGTLYQKRFATEANLIAGSAIQFAAAFVVCAGCAFAFESREIQWNTTLFVTLFWLVVVMSIGAVTLLMFLIREGAASRVSSLFYLVPPVTALQGYWLFGERLGPLQLAGIAVTAVGVALVNVPRRTPRDGPAVGLRKP